MPVHADDLTPAARKALGIDGGSTKRRSTHKGEADAAPCDGTCSCGATFDRYTTWEKHADRAGPGHHRWSMTLPSA